MYFFVLCVFVLNRIPLVSRGNKCSYYEAVSRVSGHKVTIKEHHFNNYEGQESADEAKILAKLSHACLPRLREVFLTETSLFMVRPPTSMLKLYA